MPDNDLLSIILPACNEQDNIQNAFLTISRILKGNAIPFEIIFVDDGSSDSTYAHIQALSAQSREAKGLSFSKNFGKEAAIFAGLEASRGACCLVMDCDLQHPPALIPEMYRLWKDGFEVVEGVKASRGKENPLHTLCAKGFYHLISSATGIDMSRASDFKLLDRRAVDALLILPERTPFFRALSSWIGFKTASVPFEVQERAAGTSKWSLWSLVKYAIRNITSFSGAPMQLVTLLGWIMLLASVVLGVQSLYRYFSRYHE